MPTVQDILLGDFDMTNASKLVQYATASALAQHVKENLLDAEEAKNVASFMKGIAAIPRMIVWSNLQHAGEKQNLFLVHPHIWECMVNDATDPDEALHTWMATARKPQEERDNVLRELGYL